MTEKKIIGAVGVGDKTYTAGQEAEMEAAVKAGKGNIDWDRLEAKGVVSGYGKTTAESAHTVNRQRKADGSRADEDAVEAADADTEGTTEAPKAAKKAPKRKR